MYRRKSRGMDFFLLSAQRRRERQNSLVRAWEALHPRRIHRQLFMAALFDYGFPALSGHEALKGLEVPMINVQTVIERIVALARQRGISINQVLRESGLNKSVLDNMKRGSMPSADKLAALADYFDCSVDYLLGRIDTPSLRPAKSTGSGETVPALTAEEIVRLRRLIGG